MLFYWVPMTGPTLGKRKATASVSKSFCSKLMQTKCWGLCQSEAPAIAVCNFCSVSLKLLLGLLISEALNSRSVLSKTAEMPLIWKGSNFYFILSLLWLIPRMEINSWPFNFALKCKIIKWCYAEMMKWLILGRERCVLAMCHFQTTLKYQTLQGWGCWGPVQDPFNNCISRICSAQVYECQKGGWLLKPQWWIENKWKSPH